jgi:hypothetical protein
VWELKDGSPVCLVVSLFNPHLLSVLYLNYQGHNHDIACQFKNPAECHPFGATLFPVNFKFDVRFQVLTEASMKFKSLLGCSEV